MPYHSWTCKASSKEYRAGFESTFGPQQSQFCDGCGNKLAWCDCPPIASSANFRNIGGPRYIRPPAEQRRSRTIPARPPKKPYQPRVLIVVK